MMDLRKKKFGEEFIAERDRKQRLVSELKANLIC